LSGRDAARLHRLVNMRSIFAERIARDTSDRS
jgi:hypothetical protein